MADQRLSNVIGAPFPEHVLTQLVIRADRNSTGYGSTFPTRSDEELLFLANKSSWVKLTSSVTIVSPYGGLTPKSFYRSLGLPGDLVNTSNSLRRDWILEAGTSQSTGGAGIKLREGIGPNGAYGLGGTEELGYRPMPGLTSVTIDTVGTLGSLRQANINFKVWNMNQLNIIEALYFRLGYSMLLEWGHTQFFTNARQGNTLRGTFETNTYGINPFIDQRKEIVQQEIARRSLKLSGNYDGMLGIVTNFNWSFNQEGGYDCSIRLVGLGSIVDSLRINLSYKMPGILFSKYEKQQKTIRNYEAEIKALKERNALLAAQAQERTALAASRTRQGLFEQPVPVAKNASEIYTVVAKADYDPKKVPQNQDIFLNQIAIFSNYQASLFDGNKKDILNEVPDYYYKASQNTDVKVNEMNSVANGAAGLYLNNVRGSKRAKWQLIPAGVSLATPQKASISSDKLKNVYFYTKNKQNRPDYGSLDSGLREPNKAVAVDFINNETGYYVITNNDFFKPYEIYLRGLFATTYELFGSDENLDPSTSLVEFSNEIRYDYTALVRQTDIITTDKKIFYLDLIYTMPPGGKDTVKDVLVALDTWASGEAAISIVDMKEYTQILSDVFDLGGNPKGKIPFNDIEITAKLVGLQIGNTGKGLKGEISIRFNNTAFIKEVLPNVPPSQTTNQATGAAAGGASTGDVNVVTVEQVDPSDKFASSLHAMLTAVKSYMQDSAIKKTRAGDRGGLIKDSIAEITKIMYKDGVLKDVFETGSVPILPNSQTFNVTAYAKKGFNSNLMIEPALASSPLLKDIDFGEKDGICTGYAIKYTQAESDTSINYPVYIKLGYLMAFLNNMCLIYDSTVDTDKHPYVYLDFNPNTNFCLTIPQHLSVDPFTCLIPFEGTDQDYLNIYPEPLQKAITDPLKDGVNNAVSGFIPKFKNPDNQYQGKTMEILLNVDYLLSVIDQYTSSDPTHAVYLKGFLDTIVAGINKSTGNVNLFRVSYRDDSNTVIVKDDQFVPPAAGEAYMGVRSQYLSPGGPNGQPKYGELPIFGAQSLVREMEFRTDLSTKMASMIAISAQAATGSEDGSTNSKDHTPFSYLNPYYVDAYKPKINDVTTGDENTNSNPSTGNSKNQKKGDDANNDTNQALQFNAHILSVYKGSNGKPIARDKTDFAVNYYIERMSKVKAKDKITQSAPFIPANLNITIDGIAGIVMGNAFTIPQDRLPASLRGEDGETKVGFVVVGLTHVLDNNQWLTKIRGQMIKLRDSATYGAAQQVTAIRGSFDRASTQNFVSTSLKAANLYNDAAFRARVKEIADKFNLDENDILRIAYNESGLNPGAGLYYDDRGAPPKYKAINSPATGYYAFGGGLFGFTKVVLSTIGAASVEAVIATDALTQLDYYERLLQSNDRSYGIKGADIYTLYMANFLPVLINAVKTRNTGALLQGGGLSAKVISEQNQGLPLALGKKPGDPLTVADWYEYVNKNILTRK